jgi:hypothetical protein
MKPVERLQAVFAFEKSDVVPIYDKLRNEAAIAHYAGESFDPAHGMAIALKACRVALDATTTLIYPQIEAKETTPDGFVWVRERWTSWMAERPFRDIAGVTAWVKQEIARLDAFDSAGWLAAQLSRIAEFQAQLGDTVYLFDGIAVGLDYCYRYAGLELFSYLLADEPALVARWLDAAFRANRRALAALAPSALAFRFAIIYEDIGGKTAPLFSPALLRRELFPRLRELVGIFHDLGFKVIYHSDGNLNRVLEDLVATEIDGLNPIEVQAGMDLRALKERYGKRLVLVGGIDASDLLPHSSPDQVRAATRAALEIAAPGSGYILASTTELSNAIPPENIIAMWETAREYGRYS